jgi:hypothetical protein
MPRRINLLVRALGSPAAEGEFKSGAVLLREPTEFDTEFYSVP